MLFLHTKTRNCENVMCFLLHIGVPTAVNFGYPLPGTFLCGANCCSHFVTYCVPLCTVIIKSLILGNLSKLGNYCMYTSSDRALW